MYYIIIFLVLLIIVVLYFVNRHTNLQRIFYKEGYIEPIVEGKRKGKIVFCGLARDCVENIAKNILFYKNIGQTFDDYRIVIFENDSSDGTREVIESLVDDKTELLGCDIHRCKYKEQDLYIDGLSKKRIDKMAALRNRYLKHIYDKYGDYQYMFVVDLDTTGYFDIASLDRNLADSTWSGIALNGRMPLPYFCGLVNGTYDSLAFVAPDEEYCRGESHPTNLVLKFLYLQYYCQGDKLLPVKSAFNGACLYRMQHVKNIYHETGWPCEHISFHYEMKKRGYNVYLDPRWLFYVGIQGPIGSKRGMNIK